MDETVAELYAALPVSEWIITGGMLIKRIGDPPTAEDIEDFQLIAQTRGRGPIARSEPTGYEGRCDYCKRDIGAGHQQWCPYWQPKPS